LGTTYLSLNFANYVDSGLAGKSFVQSHSTFTCSRKLEQWVAENLGDHRRKLMFVGTGPGMKEMIQIV
jgi:hypothetical protein